VTDRRNPGSTDSTEITVINDGNGIALLGDGVTIDRYLEDHQIPSRDLGVARLTSMLSVGGAAGEASAHIAATSGRWIQLTEKSAQALAQGTAMTGSSEKVARAVLVNPDNKRIRMQLEFVKNSRTGLTNPAMLSGAAGLMTQLAMQQAMDQITDYLERLDGKLDDVLRNQKDAVVADLIGVGMVIDEAITIRDEVGRVSDVTWSKVQGTQPTIFSSQGYALRKIDDLTVKLERETSMGALVDATAALRDGIDEWLAVIARCFQLQDALGVLELDRVLDSSPDELDRHRLGLRKARQGRIALIRETTGRLLSRVEESAGTANAKVLLNPFESPQLFRASNQVAIAVLDFNDRLELGERSHGLEARRWAEAVGDARAKAVQTGASGAVRAKDAGTAAANRVQSRALKISSGVGDRAKRAKSRLRRDGDPTN
jgi:hypothetical protein